MNDFWYRGDKAVSDAKRIDIIGKRMFERPMKDADMATYKEANRLATRMFIGVADGARTHDNRNHNPLLLSSIHAGLRRARGNI